MGTARSYAGALRPPASEGCGLVGAVVHGWYAGEGRDLLGAHFVVQRLGQRSCSVWSDTADLEPGIGAGLEHRSHAAEVVEERTGRRGRNSGRRCEQCFRRFSAKPRGRPLCVRGPAGSAFGPLTANRETVDPACGISLVVTSDQRHAQVDGCKADASDRIRRKWTAVDIRALDQQIRGRARRAELAELSPEAPLRHRDVQVEHTLALDERVVTDRVIAGRQRRAGK